MNSGELLHVETVWQDAVGFSLEQVFAFECCYVGDGCENISRMGGGSFYAIAVIDASLASFRVHIKVLQVVVEVDGAGAEIPTKKGSMGGENGGDIDLSLLGERQSHTSKPFVELGYHGAFGFSGHKLGTSEAILHCIWMLTSPRNHATR